MLSVVIPALNSGKTISKTLSSIFSTELPPECFEVLVIDNGSVDDTVEKAKNYPVKMFYCTIRGIGTSRNLGIRKARGEIVCFTDSDCVVERDWLEKISRFFEANPETDGVGGPVLPYIKGVNNVQRNSGEIFVEAQGYPKERTKVQFGVFNGVLFGTNAAYRKAALVSVGGFPEPSGNSPDLSWRLVSHQRLLYFDPSIRVFHMFPWTLRGVFKQQFRWGARMSSLRIRHNVFKLREVILIWYSPVKLLLFLLHIGNFSKKILSFVQSMIFSFGFIKGISAHV